MLDIHNVEGTIPLELPLGANVYAEIEVSAGGDFVIKFTNYEFAEFFIAQARDNNVIALGLHMVGARPAQTAAEKTESLKDMIELPEDVRGHAMEGGYEPHADGRRCSRHIRLGMYTPDGLNECRRVHIKNGV